MKKFISILMTILLVLTVGIMPVTLATFTSLGGGNAGSTDLIMKPAQNLIALIRWVGYIVAAVMLVYIGIKYIMASAAEKADLKEALVKYIIGAAIVVFATQIAAWVFSLSGT